MEKIARRIVKGENSYNKKISRLYVKVKVSNIQCNFNITDIMLQTGDKVGIWNGHPSEIRWSFNE